MSAHFALELHDEPHMFPVAAVTQYGEPAPHSESVTQCAEQAESWHVGVPESTHVPTPEHVGEQNASSDLPSVPMMHHGEFAGQSLFPVHGLVHVPATHVWSALQSDAFAHAATHTSPTQLGFADAAPQSVFVVQLNDPGVELEFELELAAGFIAITMIMTTTMTTRTAATIRPLEDLVVGVVKVPSELAIALYKSAIPLGPRK